MTKLVSDSITIRPIGWGDAEPLQEILKDPAVYLPARLRDSCREFSISEFIRSRIAAWQFGAAYTFVILTRNRPVGGCTLYVTEANGYRSEIGFWIGSSFWDQGIGTKAVGQTIGFGFEKLRLRVIEAKCFAGNIAAARVLAKNGLNFQYKFRSYSCYLNSSAVLNSFRIEMRP